MRGWFAMTRMLVMSSLRSRVSLFFTLAFPLIFVFVYGYIFGRNNPRALPFLAAQAFVLIVISNTLFGLANLFLDVRRKGVLRRLYATPMCRTTVLAAVLAAWILISSLTFLAMLLAFDGAFHARLAGKGPVLWGMYVLCTMAMAGVAFVLASIADRPEGVAMGANALFFPMLFFSGLSVPAFLLPEGIQRIGRVLPAHAMLEFFRSVTESREIGGMGIIYGVTIALMGVGGFLAALAVYRWDPEQRLTRAQRGQLVTALGMLLLIPWAGSVVSQSVGPLRQWLAPKTVLAVGHVFDGERVLSDSPVYLGIQEGRIAFVSSSIPDEWKGVEVRDFRRFWATPGLIDMHVHLDSAVLPIFDPSLREDERMQHDLRAGYLASGVTALRSFGDAYDPLLEQRKIAEAGMAPYPRLFLSGPVFTAPGGHPLELPNFQFMSEQEISQRVVQVSDPESGREALRGLLRRFRPDWIKIMYDSGIPDSTTLPRLSRETLQALIKEAHRQGLRVAVHVSKVEELRDAVMLGADMIEHVPIDAVIDDALLVEMRRRGTVVAPTVFALEVFRRRWTGGFPADEFILARLMKPLRERLESRRGTFDWLSFVPERDRPVVKERMLSRVNTLVQTAYTNVRRIAEAGIPLVAGSDAGNPDVYHGPGLIHEVEALVRAGLSPADALRAATARAGEALGEPIGKIRPGYKADIAIYEKNPVDDVVALRSIRWVMLRGRLYAVSDLLRE